MSPKTVHGGFMRQTRARGRLIERRDEGLLLEQIHVLSGPRDGLHLLSHIEHMEKFIPLEFLEGKNVTTGKTTHTNLLFRIENLGGHEPAVLLTALLLWRFTLIPLLHSNPAGGKPGTRENHFVFSLNTFGNNA
jgi:hypothetical protein